MFEIEEPIRVTTVLAPFSGYGSLPQENVKAAGVRGDKVHKIIEGYLDGLGLWGVDEETKPYIDSFLLWWHDQFPIIVKEKRFTCLKHNITGQCDLIVQTENGLVLIDWKTSAKENHTWKLQGSAYWYLAKEAGYEITTVWFVKLEKTGKIARQFTYDNCFDEFLKCLDIYNKYFKKQKYICTEDL